MITDAARPVKRSLQIVTLDVPDEGNLMFEMRVPAPAVLRHFHLTMTKGEQLLAMPGRPQRAKLVPVLTFEVDPEAEPIERRFYLLPFGKTAEGSGVAEMVFAGVALAPNGMPLALYELPPRAAAAPPSSLVS